MEEDRIRLKSGHWIWYRRVGDSGGTPLLTLHGGPGSGHDYLESLEKLAGDHPVIFYDQLGCGKSDQPNDASLWQLERFITELDEIRNSLNLKHVHLFGQSWGGLLAIEYMLAQPQGVASLILADSYASMPQLAQEVNRLRSKLPAKTQETLARFEAKGDFHHPEYRAAVIEFYNRYVCRLPTKPDCLFRTTANLENNPVYETMNGPNELVVTGNLREWDRTNRLSEISIPSLILAGRHDEASPACAETLHCGIAGSQLEIFENSSHIPHIEEESKYLEVVSRFLSRVDATPVRNPKGLPQHIS